MEHPKPDGDRGTAYLPARRAAASQLAAEIARVASSPVIDALLVGSATALAVLDEERQIVAVNGAYVALLGASDPVAALGLRNGEALGCVHVPEGPAGCGTSQACASCGAAIATLAAARGGLGERDCALRVERPGGHEDRVLRVRATSLLVDGERFHAFALTDVTAERRRSALQHVFLHDLANLAEGLRGAACEAEAARVRGAPGRAPPAAGPAPPRRPPRPRGAAPALARGRRGAAAHRLRPRPRGRARPFPRRARGAPPGRGRQAARGRGAATTRCSSSPTRSSSSTSSRTCS